MFQAAAAMSAVNRWQDLIAENMSSSGVTGFKRNEASFATVEAGVMTAQGANAPHFALPCVTTSKNFTKGEIVRTGTDTDLAMDNSGFFEVAMPNGDIAYTRDGGLKMGQDGTLLTKAGFPILGDSGPIVLDPRSRAPMVVSTNGEVMQGNDMKGKLRVVDLANPHVLQTLGGGYLLKNTMAEATVVSNPGIRQGFLENSNVSAVREMGNMLIAMRQFEANQRIVNMQDERMGRTITELGNPN